MKKKIIKKGYTLEVTSWENDADNYRTIKYTTEDKELAKELVDLCEKVFVSINNGAGGIGNACDREKNQVKAILIPYMKKRPKLYEKEVIKDDDHLYDIGIEWAYELMGGSEWYICRVMESVTVTYSDKDISLKTLKL